MAIRDILNSNINQIRPIGAPTRSKYTAMADAIQVPESTAGMFKGGNLATGLAAGLKGYLGMRGALADEANRQAYYDNLAQLAEQERADKLAQQAWEQDYKERALAQDIEKAQLSIDAANRRAEIERAYALQDAQRKREQDVADAELKRKQAIEDRDAQYQHEQSIYQRNREDQLQAALDAEQRKQAYEQEQMAIKQLDPAEQQRYYEIKQQGKNPFIENTDWGLLGRLFGKRKYKVSVVDALKKDGNYSSYEADIMNKGL